MEDLDKPNALEKFAPDCLCSCGEPDWFREQRGLLRPAEMCRNSSMHFNASIHRLHGELFHHGVS